MAEPVERGNHDPRDFTGAARLKSMVEAWPLERLVAKHIPLDAFESPAPAFGFGTKLCS